MKNHPSNWNTRDHARILKVFSYLYMVKFEILSRLLLSVQALAFRGRLMSLLGLRPAGSHRGLFSRRTRKASAAIHRTQKKRFSFSRSLVPALQAIGGNTRNSLPA